MHQVSNRNHYNGFENRALEPVGRFKQIGAQEHMTSDCPDGYCKQKIQAVDDAIGYKKNEWAILLKETNDYEDVMQALRFCEIFKLEAKVSVLDEGFAVEVKSDVLHDLKIFATKTTGYGNLFDDK